jgi:hypothetical protein
VEIVMDATLVEPCLTDEGISFMVTVGFVQRECVVSKEALAHLRQMHGFSMDLMNIYRAFEAKINSVARCLVLAGEPASPLLLGPQCFH